MLPLRLSFSLAICALVIGLCHGVCLSTFFSCANKRCIPKDEVCDNKNDCGDWSDERLCGPRALPKEICGPKKFTCDDGRCILLAWKCDGQNDCFDGSDEALGCFTNCSGFVCTSRQCIPRKWVCDGTNDCGDSSDEQDCINILTKEEIADRCNISYHFLCKDSLKCIDISRVCDNKPDCRDGSDEGIECGSDYCNIYGCSQQCRKGPERPICTCKEGYRLLEDQKTCTDIDECATGTSLCSQLCANLEGGYLCSCMVGYRKHDKGGCTAEGVSPLLIYTSTSEIKVIRLRTEEYWTPFKGLEQTVAVVYDGVDNVLYWNKNSDNKESIMKSKLDGSDAEVFPIEGLQSVESLAIDWIARNLYYTDVKLKQIGACSIHEIVCVSVIQNLSLPTSLVLDPIHGFMYWSDRGIPHIGKSGMDGSNSISFVSTAIKNPGGLALDPVHKRLYWTDSQLNHIESIQTNGQNRKIILEEVISHPYSMDIFEDSIYWTDWNSRSVQSCNKITGKNLKTLAKVTAIGIPMGLHVYHPVSQLQETNPCYGSLCTHVCLLSPRQRYTCKCKPGYTLAQDGRACLETPNATFILIAMRNELFKYYQNTMGKHVLNRIRSRHIKNVHKMIYDNRINVLYIAQPGRLYGFYMSNSTLFPLLPYSLDIKDMVFHAAGRNLYILDILRHHIGVFNVDRKIYVVLTVLPSPVAIELLPEKSIMFIALATQHSGLLQMNMDGSNKQFLISHPANSISAILLDRNSSKIYWIDNRKPAIFKASYALNSKSEIFQRNTGKSSSMLIFQNTLYWIKYEPNVELNWKQLSPKSLVFSLNLPHNKFRIQSPPVMTLIDKTHPIPEKYECTECSHFCLPRPDGITCKCPTMMKLNEDKKTCSIKQNCSEFEFMCKTGACIPQSTVCNKNPDCPDGSDEVNCQCSTKEFDCPTGSCIPLDRLCNQFVDCPGGEDEMDCGCLITEFQCEDRECISKIWRCDGNEECDDGSDELDCTYDCSNKQFKCPSGRCISKKWVCDETEDCEDGADERDCVRDCFVTEFVCSNGRCIDRMAVCDDHDDCGDGSDEYKCSKEYTCGPDMFQCNSGKCIPETRICNYMPDCPDGDDEVDCLTRWANIICRKNQFRCSDGHCIPLKWTCDGDKDCPENEDEIGPQCPDKIDPASQCLSDTYRCNNKKCIDITLVCNGVADCKDGSDEDENCELHCIDHNGGCSQICIPTPRGPICRCKQGFILGEDQASCQDINECDEYGTCSHFCSNTVGSFQCSCAPGYGLSLNNKSCKVEGEKAQMIIASTSRIIQLAIDRSHMKIIVQDNTTLIPSSVDYLKDVIYWAEYSNGTINKVNVTSEVVIKNLTNPKAIAIDPSSNNIFYAEDNAISVCSLKVNFCALILTTEENVLSLALDPALGLMFWSVNSSFEEPNGKIYSSWMTGNNTEAIVETNVFEPLDLVTDLLLKRLFWIDRASDVLETCDMNGNHRYVLVKDAGDPIALTLFEDFVYWASAKHEAIMKCNKFKCGMPMYFKTDEVLVNDIIIQHEILQHNSEIRCRNSCSHLCIPIPQEYVCVCPPGYQFMHSSTRFCESLWPTDNATETTLPVSATKPTGPTNVTIPMICPLHCGDGECVILNNTATCKCNNGTFATFCDAIVSATFAYSKRTILVAVFSFAVVFFLILIGYYFIKRTSVWQNFVLWVVSIPSRFRNRGEALMMSEYEHQPMISPVSSGSVPQESTLSEPQQRPESSASELSERTLTGEDNGAFEQEARASLITDPETTSQQSSIESLSTTTVQSTTDETSESTDTSTSKDVTLRHTGSLHTSEESSISQTAPLTSKQLPSKKSD